MARRIVLLSDGTGNSSAKVWRTNVWRLFESLDLSDSQQVACYDDGVGSSSFAPLRILGGVFGVGLKRNVLNLYKFACRNHRSPQDEIFGFGFSRGAFTIRVTIGLILDQGLVNATPLTDSELDRLAKDAYRRYHRRHFHTNWRLIWRAIAGLFRAPKPLAAGPYPIPIVRFLGLWDTVAAYGLPVEEMTQGVNQWIKPLEIPSHTLNPLVQRACHALSLDDERTTFHPVLWDEPIPPASTVPRLTTSEKITQVWFSGVHANVGGGYPDDSLAKIPLYWIMEEASQCGLAFKTSPLSDPDSVVAARSSQDKDGRLYDSRDGVGSYYRFGPRRLSRLCNQIFSRSTGDKVFVQRPKIHETVLNRIRNNAHVYAPIGIPDVYDVVRTVPPAKLGDKPTFEIVPLSASAIPNGTPETQATATARVNAERHQIWPLIHWRSFVYILTVVATLAFVIFPFSGRPDLLGVRASGLRMVSDAIIALSGFLPSWAGGWIAGYGGYPTIFLGFVFSIGVLLLASRKLAVATSDRMETLWRQSLAGTIVDPGAPSGKFYNFRVRLLAVLEVGWKEYAAPALTALLLVYAALVTTSHVAFNILDDAGKTCQSVGTPEFVPEDGVLISFKPSELCHASGYKVGRLDKYLIWTNPNPQSLTKSYPKFVNGSQSCSLDQVNNELTNGDVATGPGGYSTFHNEGLELTWFQMAKHLILLPLRRDWRQPWFQLIGRYGVKGGEEEFLEPDADSAVKVISEVVQPKIKGELFFYVNDAVVGIPALRWFETKSWYDYFYADNKGCISVFIFDQHYKKGGSAK